MLVTNDQGRSPCPKPKHHLTIPNQCPLTAHLFVFLPPTPPMIPLMILLPPMILLVMRTASNHLTLRCRMTRNDKRTQDQLKQR